MSKVTITSIFEVSKALATEAGQQLADVINYMADFGEQSLRALRNGLTYENNFAAQVLLVEFTHEVPQIVRVTKAPKHIHFTRVFSSTNGLANWLWTINDANELVVTLSFDGAPTDPITVQLVVGF